MGWVPAYVGIGSNLDDPAAHVGRALRDLAGLPATRLVRASRLFRNPPMAAAPQPDFVNAVAALLTSLDAEDLLQQLHGVERLHGRRRMPGEHWAPRVLDLDLLAYGERRMHSATITVPHPGIPARNFVLFPLLEIAPDLRIPGAGLVRELAGALDPTGLVPIG